MPHKCRKRCPIIEFVCLCDSSNIDLTKTAFCLDQVGIPPIFKFETIQMWLFGKKKLTEKPLFLAAAPEMEDPEENTAAARGRGRGGRLGRGGRGGRGRGRGIRELNSLGDGTVTANPYMNHL